MVSEAANDGLTAMTTCRDVRREGHPFRVPWQSARKASDKVTPQAMGTCPTCGASINGLDDFTDELSRREYAISGLCQECQNATFGANGDDDLAHDDLADYNLEEAEDW